jgi:hypothetical protein
VADGKPAREKNIMKKIALAIAFAVASMPLTFAAQTPAQPVSGSGQSTTATPTKKTVKKSSKKTKKSETTKAPAASK